MKSLRFFLLAFFLLIQATAFAQVTIRGFVIDSTTNEGLVGANVRLQGTALGGSSDREGRFTIMRVPSGTYTLIASYVGYGSRSLNINVARADLSFSIVLHPEYVEGKEVVITGQMRGQTAAINQQLSSNTIVNVVSEEKIKELPDANAAEALGRLPGVSVIRSGGEATKVTLRGLPESFAAITIDGVRLASTDSTTRDVDLSTISQSSLAGIELFKALTPDMDGDAIAGSVNFVTKKAPAQRSLQVDAIGDYSRLNKTAKQYETALRYGERFFGDILGVQVNGNYERRDRSNETYSVNSTSAYQILDKYAVTNFALNYTNEIRKRGGVNLMLDVNTPDSGSIRINNLYNRTDRNYILYSRNYPFPTQGNTQVFYNMRDREQDIDIFNSSIRGDNSLLGLKVNWSAAFAQSRSKFPFDYELDFQEPSTIQAGNIVSGMAPIPSTVWTGPPEAAIPYALNNFDVAYMYDGMATAEKTNEAERTVSLDLARGYSLGSSWSGTFKVGGKYRSVSRFRDEAQDVAQYYINGYYDYTQLPDGSIVRKSTSLFPGTRFANLKLTGSGLIVASNFLDPGLPHRNVFDKYDLYPVLSDDALRLWYDFSRNGRQNAQGLGLEYSPNLERASQFYDVSEKVSAGYVMNSLNFGQMATLIAGLRVESESNGYLAKYTLGSLTGFPTPAGALGDTTSSHKETLWLPNFQLTIRPNDFMSVRLAAYKALSRPSFNQRLNTFIARDGGQLGGVTVYIGNPRLKDSRSWNYEVSTSFFGNTIGLFTVSAYYKEIKFLPYVLNGANGTGQRFLDSLGIPWTDPFLPIVSYNLTYPINSSKKARVWGFELEHQANLNFLPGLLGNTVLSYNLSLARSEAYIAYQPQRVDTVLVPSEFGPVPTAVRTFYFTSRKEKIPGMPEFTANVALGYDIGGFSGRVSMYHQGEYNQSFTFDHRADIVVDGFTRWDFSARQKINQYLSIIFNLNNFTNVKEGTSTVNRGGFASWSVPATSLTYGLTANLGIRATVF